MSIIVINLHFCDNDSINEQVSKGGLVMKHILNKDVERQQNLLLLMFKDNDWKTTKDISEALECNIKTLRQDIDYLTTEYDEIISCEYSKSLGYKFHIQNGHSIQEIFLDWIKHSLFFSIITDVLYEKNKGDADYFYNTYFISETTLKRQVALINYHLKEVGMSLSLTKMTFKVTDEFVARLFFGNREMEKRSIYDWDEEHMDNQALSFLIIDRLEEHFKIELTFLQKNMVAYFVLCSVIRSSGDYFLGDDSENILMEDAELQNYLYDVINPLTNKPYLTCRAQINDTLHFLEQLFILLKKHYSSPKAKTIATQLTSKIAEKMNAPAHVFNQELVVKDIAYVLFVREKYPYTMSYINHRGYFNSEAIRHKYPVFYRAVMQAFEELPEEHRFMAHYSTELINSLFRYWLVDDYDYITQINQVNIFISTTLDANQAKMIQYIFEKAFNNKINVIGYEYGKTGFNSDKENPLFKKADLIICNHLFYKQLPNVMVVDDIIDDAKLLNINHRLDTIRLSK